ncbi:MAG TPA: MAPEG family protein, partial [Myxococcota bacterium]|nr:MAPEG family protein [Myxococcota bacterium]
MDRNAILYPGIAMFFLTFAMVLYLGVARYLAIRRGDVSIKFYRLFAEGQQPERLQLISRHVQNHFEIPPLFYVVLLFTHVAGQVTAHAVGL